LKAVAQIEFLLIDPVTGAVDERIAAVGREGADGAGGEVLDVQIVLADVSDASASAENLANMSVDSGALPPSFLRPLDLRSSTQ
jgi:hypothetical protein